MMRRADRLAEAGRLAVLGAVLVILVLPIFLSVLLSFDSRDFLGPLPPPGFSLQWYRSFMTSDIYINGLVWSLAVLVVTVVISTVAGVMAALFLHDRRFPGREALLTFFLSAFLIPHLVVGFAILLASARFGIDSAFLRLVAGHILLTMPFTIRTTLVGLQGVPKSFAEAGLTLGARPGRVFWDITFPLVRPGIIASAVFAASVSLGEVSASVFLSDNVVRTLPVALFGEMVSSFDLTIAAASGILVATTVAMVLLLDSFVGLERITGRGTYSKR